MLLVLLGVLCEISFQISSVHAGFSLICDPRQPPIDRFFSASLPLKTRVFPGIAGFFLDPVPAMQWRLI
jgi:hypothetical protein